MESHATGEAGHWWLNESLKRLQESYRSRFGASLIIIEGEALEVIQKLVKKYQRKPDEYFGVRLENPAFTVSS